MCIELRRATQKDLDTMMPLFRDLYKGDIGPHFTGVLQEYIGSDSHLVTVAIADAHIVALLVGSYRLDVDYECRAGFIDAVVVHEDRRRQEIGKQLVRNFAEWARSRNCTVLQVLNGRRPFFENLDFKERVVTFHQVPTGTMCHELLRTGSG